MCSNYRQAVMELDKIAVYFRDFAGAAAMASKEESIQEMLDSVTMKKAMAELDQIAEGLKAKRPTKKKGS